MAAQGRSDLSTLAITTNVNNNATKDIQASNIRDQYDNERDSSINIVDDGLLPKDTSGEKTIELTSPPVLLNVGANDLTSRSIVEELIVAADTNPNFKDVSAASYTIEDGDNGKLLYHNLATSDFLIPLASNIELLRVSGKATNDTSITPVAGVSLVDARNVALSSWTSVATDKVVSLAKIGVNAYKVIEVKEPFVEFNDLLFSVSSDAVVSDDIAFNKTINIDQTSEVLHPFIDSVTYETSTDGSSYTSYANIALLQAGIISIGNPATYTVRVISVINVGSVRSATVGFSYN